MALTSLIMTAVGAFSNTMVIGKDWCDEPGIVETNQEYAAVYVVVAVSFTFINLVMNDQRQDKTRQDKTQAYSAPLLHLFCSGSVVGPCLRTTGRRHKNACVHYEKMSFTALSFFYYIGVYSGGVLLFPA